MNALVKNNVILINYKKSKRERERCEMRERGMRIYMETVTNRQIGCTVSVTIQVIVIAMLLLHYIFLCEIIT